MLEIQKLIKALFMLCLTGYLDSSGMGRFFSCNYLDIRDIQLQIANRYGFGSSITPNYRVEPSKQEVLTNTHPNNKLPIQPKIINDCCPIGWNYDNEETLSSIPEFQPKIINDCCPIGCNYDDEETLSNIPEVSTHDELYPASSHNESIGESISSEYPLNAQNVHEPDNEPSTSKTAQFLNTLDTARSSESIEENDNEGYISNLHTLVDSSRFRQNLRMFLVCTPTLGILIGLLIYLYTY